MNCDGSVPRTCVVHVGLNKTGSTWLQSSVLPHVTSHALVGRYPGSDRSILNVVDEMQRSDSFAQGSLRAKAEQLAGRSDRIFFTDENLSTTLIFETQELFERNVERLEREFTDARILLVVRSQPGLILSSYAHYVRGGGTATLERFLTGEPVTGFRRPYRFRFENYDLHRIYSTFASAFGADNVVVVPYEWLKLDPHTFVVRAFSKLEVETDGIEGIAELAAQTVHSSRSALARSLQRRLNLAASLVVRSNVGSQPWYGRVRGAVGSVDRVLRLDRLSALNRRLSKRNEAVARSRGADYAASNRLLADVTGLPLEQLGYPI